MPEIQEPSKITKLFTTGGSKAVRLPAAFITGDMEKVILTKQGNKIVIEPYDEKKTQLSWQEFWKDFFERAPLLDDDFHIERDHSPPRPVPDLF